MVPYFRRNITLALSLVGLIVLAASFLLLANTDKPTSSVELGIAEHSPLGAEGGLVVPASCPSYDHTTGGACSSCPTGYSYDINGVCQADTATLDQPTMNTPLCSADGTQATFSWGTVPASAGPLSSSVVYAFRLDNPSNNTTSCVDGWYCSNPPDQIVDDYAGTSYTTGVTPGTLYRWWVHAKYSGTWTGISGYTQLSMKCLAPPASVTASCNADHATARLSWSTSAGATSYRARFKYPTTVTSCPSGWTLFTDSQTCYNNNMAATFVDIPISSGVTYDAWVRAADGPYFSDLTHVPGNAFTCTIPTLAQPTNPTVTCGSGGTTATLSWGNSGNGIVYAPRYKGAGLSSCPAGWTHANPSDPTECDIDDVSGTSVIVSTTPGTTYQWWVHAKYPNTWNGLSAAQSPLPSFSCPAGGSSTGSILVKRVGSDDTMATAPAGTVAYVDGTSYTANPATAPSLSTSVTHTVAFTDVANYTETVGSCTFATGGAECSVTTFNLTPTCNGSTCTISPDTTVSSNVTTKYAVKYTATTTADPTITCSASSVTLGSSITGTVSGGSSANDWVGIYDPSGNLWYSQLLGTLTRPTNVTLSTNTNGGAGTWSLKVFKTGNNTTPTGTCSFTATTVAATIDVQTVRVGSAQTTASVPPGTTSSLDGSAGDPTNPNVYSGVSAATHTATFTDLASYTETMGYCHYAPGSSCSVSTFGTLTPTCNGTTCSVTTPYQAGSYTRVAVMYTAVAGTGEVMIKRVGSDLTINTAPAGGQSALDNASWSQTNPYVYSGATAGSHTANFSDISGYTAMAGTCTYTTGGSECSVSTFTTTPTCSGGVCAVPITVSSGVTTKVAVQYLQNPTGSILVKRVGSDLTVATAPSGTVAYVDGTSYTANPATAPSLSTSVTHTVAFTDVANYTETVGSCTFATGGAECSVTTFNLTPTCNGSTCTISPDTTVSSNVTTKYAVQYTSTAATPTCTISSNQTSASPGSSVTLSWTNSANTISASINSGANVSLNSSGPYTIPSNATIGSTVAYTMTPYSSTGTSGSCSTSVTVVSPTTPTCAITPSTTAVPYGGGYASLTTSAGNGASYGYFNGAYMGTNLSTTQTPYVTSSGTQTMQVYNSSGVSASCSATVTVCASGQTVSNGACVSSTPAPTCTITASPTSTTSGGSVTLTKTSSDATSATLNGVATATSGTSTVNPTTTTTYTMDVSGAGGSGSCSTTVTVGSSGSGISCSAPSVTPGGSISGTVSGGSSASDWVSVFAASEPANSMNYFASGASPAYQFVSLPRPQVVTFTAPSTAGSYELRAQSNGSYTTFASCPFTVGSSGSCPAGYGGTYPNCTCPTGYTGTYPSCTPSQTTGAVMIKRVDSNSNVLSTATASYVDSTSGSTTVNPSTFSSLSQGAHTAYFGDLSGYTETLGTCQFATGGTECTVSSFPTTPTCGAGICSTPVTVTAGQTTKIAVRYVGATTGDIMIKRVDAALNLFSGTAAYVDGTPSGSNPATFSSLSTSGTHSASFTDAGGYTEQVGTCAYVTGGTECTVSTFPTTPSCASGLCSLPAFAVTSGQTMKVVVQYTAIGNPVIDLHIQDPGSIRVHSGDSVTVVWNVTNGAGWTGVLTGPGVSGGGLSGSVTKVITAQSVFTLTLTPPSGSGLSPVTKSLTVSLIPAGSEI